MIPARVPVGRSGVGFQCRLGGNPLLSWPGASSVSRPGMARLPTDHRRELTYGSQPGLGSGKKERNLSNAVRLAWSKRHKPSSAVYWQGCDELSLPRRNSSNFRAGVIEHLARLKGARWGWGKVNTWYLCQEAFVLSDVKKEIGAEHQHMPFRMVGDVADSQQGLRQHAGQDPMVWSVMLDYVTE